VSVRVYPSLSLQLKKYGADSAVKCFNCGNCTAACGLTDQDSSFPRRYIRYIQLGLKEKMLGSLDPWLCFYCGDCSATCPREAEPGNLMMASRRWLTSMYDWTGISRRIYASRSFELGMLAVVALVVMGLFTLPSQFGFRLLAGYPEALQNVNMERFAPVHLVHVGDLILAGVLGGLLLSNAARMVYFVRRQGAPMPFGLLITQAKEFIIQFFTQKRWRGCTTSSTKVWLRHLLLVTGYITMAVLVEAFIRTFQVPDSSFHWTSILGYYATAVLLGASAWMLVDRIRKRDQLSKHSDLTDWAFLILLFLTALSGIIMHTCRMLNLPLAAYTMYMVHLMIAVPMLVVMVPFGKWSHLLYRPLAQYLLAVQRKVRETEPQKLNAQPAAIAAD